MSKINVRLIGGPLDGFEGFRQVELVPGKLPMLGHKARNEQYVYQARCFMECKPDGPLVMDFVQVIRKNEDVYE